MYNISRPWPNPDIFSLLRGANIHADSTDDPISIRFSCMMYEDSGSFTSQIEVAMFVMIIHNLLCIYNPIYNYFQFINKRSSIYFYHRFNYMYPPN